MKSPNIYAIYLPQFYETENNNRWWGEGFTDWVTVRKAESLFEGHIQPNVPLNHNYYNPTEIKTLEHQADMAKRYGIDGFVFYHYWFGEGKMELEKPAECLLDNEQIDTKFCFSWANQSWVRTWSKFKGNVWGEKIDDENVSAKDDGMLVEQKYGGIDEWRKHFYYLLPFFKDKRYICVDEKPVFIFYAPLDICCLEQMIGCWRGLATKNGLKGLYLMGYNLFENSVGLDALIMPEPTFSIRKINKDFEVNVKNGVRCIDYSVFWENTIATLPAKNIKSYFTGACGFDTTPRRGNTGECLVDRKPQLFKKFLKELLIKTACYNNDFLLINAWNEWGEGMYLEPDENDGFAYLEAVKMAKNEFEGQVMDAEKEYMNLLNIYGKRDDEQSFLLGKYQFYYKSLSMWLNIRSAGEVVFSSFLKEIGANSVAIYGFADIGRKLYRQLQREKIKVEFAIDQYVGDGIEQVKVYRPEEDYPDVDIIIVTAYEPNAIRNKLKKKKNCNVFSIQEVLERIQENME